MDITEDLFVWYLGAIGIIGYIIIDLLLGKIAIKCCRRYLSMCYVQKPIYVTAKFVGCHMLANLDKFWYLNSKELSGLLSSMKMNDWCVNHQLINNELIILFRWVDRTQEPSAAIETVLQQFKIKVQEYNESRNGRFLKIPRIIVGKENWYRYNGML